MKKDASTEFSWRPFWWVILTYIGGYALIKGVIKLAEMVWGESVVRSALRSDAAITVLAVIIIVGTVTTLGIASFMFVKAVRDNRASKH